ncbi:MAG: amidophosphoribosyltransferase [Acidobacteria bacterium]|nr:amidophosphoribosyltransferase [Acidobacteriota bacterium]MCA1610333.1 amidophosphoribosyltransferase [Acidobacteriota bacterium]MCA1617384.1 amidophosphoribosyltransferase [Acidobacteriota bacterium]
MTIRNGFKDECGVFGVFDAEDAARLAYLGLYALQHRGQESAGIATLDSQVIRFEREMGYVADVFTEARLERLPGRTAIGHVRYSTTGASLLINAQPIVFATGRGPLALAHNGNLVNARDIRATLEASGALFTTTSDSEVILHLIARSRAPTLVGAIAEALTEVRGAYSILILSREGIFAARDPNGIRPLSLGIREGSPVVASETCAFDLIEARFERDVEPGEIVRLSSEGFTSHRFAFPQATPCVFEHVYFARPDSNVFGRNVASVREAFGARLAREHPAAADVVIPVPDSGMYAALGYARESGIPFAMGLVRNHYVGRTFIEPKQSIRHFGVKVKLNPVREVVSGKRIVMVDDSLVRGTTSRKIVKMLRDAGTKEVHVRISSPPTMNSCHYGIDTPTKGELIAANRPLEGIREFIGADSLGYLSPEGMLEAFGRPSQAACTACFTGVYPVDIDQPEREKESAISS